MTPTNDFLIQAQGRIERVVRANRPKLLELHGNIKTDLKADHTVVTDLDKSIEKELRATLQDFDKSIGFEGEEFGIEGSRETYWLIDPIDGTENFVRGLPFVRNMVTLVDKNQPVFTCIYKPVSDEIYVAAKGEGAYRNGKPISIESRPIERSWIELAALYKDPATINIINSLNKRINGFRTIGEFTYVAEGRLDGLLGYKAGGGPWDYAPRALLIQEAGGRVANIGKDSYDFKNTDFLMANPEIFDEMMGVITDAIATT
jgi:myo-inositol-1(or 4)-monophosphatase